MQASRFEHFYAVHAVPTHFASGHVVHVANLKPPQTLFLAVIEPSLAKRVDGRGWSTVSPRGARQDAGRLGRFVKDSADGPVVFSHSCLQPPFREITWHPSRMWARALSRVAA